MDFITVLLVTTMVAVMPEAGGQVAVITVMLVTVHLRHIMPVTERLPLPIMAQVDLGGFGALHFLELCIVY